MPWEQIGGVYQWRPDRTCGGGGGGGDGGAEVFGFFFLVFLGFFIVGAIANGCG